MGWGRVLDERAALLKRLAEKSRSRMAANYREEAAALDRHAETIGKMLLESQLLNKCEGREDAA